MKPTPANDPTLQRFKAALKETYGDRIDRIVLFGSRARGDARTESDYDIAVFLKELPDARVDRELRRFLSQSWLTMESARMP
jgi:predicted nucleotidyltransferase